MKAIATISTMILAAGMAAGQTAPAKKPAAPASQSTTTSKPAAKPAAAATAPAKPAAAKADSKPAAKPAESASASAAAKGKRDPFISPVVQRVAGGQSAMCSTGKRCLIIDQLTLQGVVKTGSGWIAVVGNPAKKVYYLRANDAVFDGYVMRIDGDSVVFKMNTIDAMGKQSEKEIVKRVAPSV
jgi:hypothetical protein